MDVLSRVLARIAVTQPAPGGATAVVTGLIALVLVAAGFTWPWVRLLVTISHEGAHALVAWLTGRRLRGIRLHRDTSGVTVSQGPARGPGMIATLAAGYPAPAVVGVVAAAVLGSGHAAGFLWLVLALLVLMLVQIRNGYGLIALVGVGAVLFAATCWLSDVWLVRVAQVLCWTMLLAAPRPVLEVLGRPERSSDPGQLARLTRLPATVWGLLFLLLTVTGLVGGAALMLPLGQWAAMW